MLLGIAVLVGGAMTDRTYLPRVLLWQVAAVLKPEDPVIRHLSFHPWVHPPSTGAPSELSHCL